MRVGVRGRGEISVRWNSFPPFQAPRLRTTSRIPSPFEHPDLKRSLRDAAQFSFGTGLQTKAILLLLSGGVSTACILFLAFGFRLTVVPGVVSGLMLALGAALAVRLHQRLRHHSPALIRMLGSDWWYLRPILGDFYWLLEQTDVVRSNLVCGKLGSGPARTDAATFLLEADQLTHDFEAAFLTPRSSGELPRIDLETRSGIETVRAMRGRLHRLMDRDLMAG